MSAGLLALALAPGPASSGRLLIITVSELIARNYDGSLWEWSADPSLPLLVDR